MSKLIGAQQLLDELIKATRPPASCPIKLREREPTEDVATNWMASVEIMPPVAIDRFDSALNELRRQHPHIDWEGITTRESQWRVISGMLT